MERAVALAVYDHLTPEDLPERLRRHAPEQLIVESDDSEELMTLAELGRRYTQRVMQAVGGNKSKAARVLGIDRRTLYRMFEREDGAEQTDEDTDAQETAQKPKR